ncbi:hypothetical protein [Sphingobacterium griseoflavum]|uniref:hypothetical protein n=1 Tax=Sphingobacterium griseoflavum TaxID=1474952 RepID=UPI001679D0D8|nr:hypothetical protein [Sphingobacterium griseoflavum]
MQQKSATGFWLLLPYKSNAPVPGLGTPCPGEGHKRIGHAYWLWRYGNLLFAAAAKSCPGLRDNLVPARDISVWVKHIGYGNMATDYLRRQQNPVPGLGTPRPGEGHKRMGKAYWLWQYGYLLFAAAAQLLPYKSNAPVPGLGTTSSRRGTIGSRDYKRQYILPESSTPICISR